MINEARGEVYYGIHFYPGLAQYENKQKVFLNENTLRDMDSTFAACPVFVEHVNEVEQNLDELRKEADGWVVESFFNQADGKHWVKFVIVSEQGKQAVRKGMKLSNCYVANDFGPGGRWNGIPYEQEITKATYEHLAIVSNPRYEESVIMNPEQFKKYNEEKLSELKRISNSIKEKPKMVFNWFKKEKVESPELEAMSVTLPLSGKEVSIVRLINEADEMEKKKGEPQMANMDHHVEMDGKKMTVNELMGAYKDCAAALHMHKQSMEKNAESEGEKQTEKEEPKAEEKAEENSSDDEKKGDQIRQAPVKNHFEIVKNAADKAAAQKPVAPDLSMDKVARGKQRYGRG